MIKSLGIERLEGGGSLRLHPSFDEAAVRCSKATSMRVVQCRAVLA